jgi:hypothetical protein
MLTKRLTSVVYAARKILAADDGIVIPGVVADR